jgi:hypothetical protein
MPLGFPIYEICNSDIDPNHELGKVAITKIEEREHMVKDFFKFWTIANTVWQIVNNFVTAGGPSVNPQIVAQETSKDLKRRVEAGYLPKSILVDHEDIIREAIDNHPHVQNFPDSH